MAREAERWRGGVLTACALLAAWTSLPAAARAQNSPAPAVVASPAFAVPLPQLTGAVTTRNVDPAIAGRAKEWLHRLAVANIDRAQLDGPANALLTDRLAAQVSARLRPLGDPTAFRFVGTRRVAGNTAYMFLATYKTATLDWVFMLDDANKISGLRVVPIQ